VIDDPAPNVPDLLTAEEVAVPLRVKPATVTRWAREGKIDSLRTPGGQLRFRREDVEALIESGSAA